MAAAAAVGGGMKHRFLAVGGVGLAAGVSARASTFYVTISGLGGEPDYDQRFKMWSEDIDSSLKKSGGDTIVMTLQTPTRDTVRTKLAEVARQAKANDGLVVMLIGHGSF